MPRYFEDYQVGEKFISPGRTVTDADISIVLGIGRYIDPFMIDEEYAKETVFGGRIAAGRFIIFMMGGLVGMSHFMDLETAIAVVGLDKIRFRSPLRAGDTIKVEVELVEKKETSKADRGITVHKETCKNQRGEIVAEMESTHMVKRRIA